MKSLIFSFLFLFTIALNAQVDTVIVNVSNVKTVQGKKITTLTLKETQGKVSIDRVEDLTKDEVIIKLEQIAKDTANCNLALKQIAQSEEYIRNAKKEQRRLKNMYERMMTKLNNILSQM